MNTPHEAVARMLAVTDSLEAELIKAARLDLFDALWTDDPVDLGEEEEDDDDDVADEIEDEDEDAAIAPETDEDRDFIATKVERVTKEDPTPVHESNVIGGIDGPRPKRTRRPPDKWTHPDEFHVLRKLCKGTSAKEEIKEWLDEIADEEAALAMKEIGEGDESDDDVLEFDVDGDDEEDDDDESGSEFDPDDEGDDDDDDEDDDEDDDDDDDELEVWCRTPPRITKPALKRPAAVLAAPENEPSPPPAPTKSSVVAALVAPSQPKRRRVVRA